MKLSAAQQYLIDVLIDGRRLKHRAPRSVGSKGDYEIVGGGSRLRGSIFTDKTLLKAAEWLDQTARELQNLRKKAGGK